VFSVKRCLRRGRAECATILNSALAPRSATVGPEGIPATSQALLALLPQAVRNAVLARFRISSAASAVGSGVGTNGNAARIDYSDGVVSS
jgi:hypothetical protein